MGLIEIASGNSVWRGMDYYENHKVVSWNKSGNSTYEGVVSDIKKIAEIEKEMHKKCPSCEGQ